MAGGVLSDVYYPTIDNTNVETLRYVVTDGSTFTDVQGRDTTYSVAPIPAPAGWSCRVVTTAKSGKYEIVTDYVTDPARDALVMKVALQGERAGAAAGSTSASTRPSTGTAAAGAATVGPTTPSPIHRPGTRSSWPTTR